MHGDDFMEMGDSGIVPLKDGWFLNKNTGETIDPHGVIYNKEGDVVYDPSDEDANRFDPEEYDFFDK